MNKRGSIMLVMLALCLLFDASIAFSIRQIQSKSSVVLRASALDDKERRPDWKDVRPDWIDRPRERANFQDYSNIEIGIGRVAMVGFCGLLAVEVMSGRSFSQQILDAVMTVSSN